MRIDTQVNTNKNVEAVDYKAKRYVEGKGIAQQLFPDAGVTTMNATTLAKNSVMEGLSPDGSLESLQERASVLKDNLSEIFTQMDTGKVVTMEEDGLNINDMETEKIVTVVEQIQIKLAMWCDDFSLVGTDVDLSDVQKTLGAGAAAYKIAAAMKERGMIPTKENVSEAVNALDTYLQTTVPDDGVKAYLLTNKQEPSIQNVYLAEYSGSDAGRGEKLSEEAWKELVSQVRQILEDAGMTPDRNTIERGRFMIEHGIEINAENFSRLQELDAVSEPEEDFIIDRIVATMIEGYHAADTFITGKTLPWEETARAIRTLRHMTPENVMALVSSRHSEPFTLDALADVQMRETEEKPDDRNLSFVKAYRQLQEIRLMMTIEAGRTLEKNGIAINTLELSALIDELKQIEAGALSQTLGDGRNVAIGEVTIVNEIMLAMEDLKGAPHVVLGSVVKEALDFTAQNLSDAQIRLRPQLTKADAAYEALRTEVRSDLGDSLKKAVEASTDDILSDLGYEDNEANRRAVRILAFHQMEMTEEHIAQVKRLDSSVNRLFDNLTPERTLHMIRDGVDPLNTDIESLNQYLNQLEDTAAKEQEKYSEFLYRLEQHGEITQEERAQYIGIYRMIYQFEQDGMNALGGLLQQGTELTLGNLFHAYMSGKDRGVSYAVDDDMETIQVRDQVTYYRNLFHSIKNQVTPELLSQPQMSPEQLAQSIREQQKKADDAVYVHVLDEMKQIESLSPEVLRFVTEYQIQTTLPNLKAANRIYSQAEALFHDYEEQTEIPIDFAAVLDEKESLQNAYEQLADHAQTFVREALYKEDSYMDLDTLRRLGQGMAVLSHLARRNNYYIPYQQDGKNKVMNVRVLENGDHAGTFSIRMASEQYGAVTVEGKVDQDSIHVQMMSDRTEGVNALAERIPSLQEQLTANGFVKIRMYSAHVTSQPVLHAGALEDVKTERIFQAAKIFVLELAK